MLNENSFEMPRPSEVDDGFGQVETSRHRSVSPTFLHALGLMRLTTEKTTDTRVPLSKLRDTDTILPDINTSASKKPKRPHKKSSTLASVAEKTSAVKKGRVSKPKEQKKKRSHATSVGELQSIPVVVEKKHKSAARATRKPTTKAQKHGASRSARKVSSSALGLAVKTADNLSETTSDVDPMDSWLHILQNDFKTTNYCSLLEGNDFNEGQINVLQKSFQILSRTFCRKFKRHERVMKIFECIECPYTVSHECVAIDSTEYWTFAGTAPCVEPIIPEETTMCLCNFTLLHSHRLNPTYETEPLLPLPSPTSLPLAQTSFNVCCVCVRCNINIYITTQDYECSRMMYFISIDNPIRKQFCKNVCFHLNDESNKAPDLSNFYACKKLCCMIFHRCNAKSVARSTTPVQIDRPLLRCFSRENM